MKQSVVSTSNFPLDILCPFQHSAGNHMPGFVSSRNQPSKFGDDVWCICLWWWPICRGWYARSWKINPYQTLLGTQRILEQNGGHWYPLGTRMKKILFWKPNPPEIGIDIHGNKFYRT